MWLGANDKRHPKMFNVKSNVVKRLYQWLHIYVVIDVCPLSYYRDDKIFSLFHSDIDICRINLQKGCNIALDRFYRYQKQVNISKFQSTVYYSQTERLYFRCNIPNIRTYTENSCGRACTTICNCDIVTVLSLITYSLKRQIRLSNSFQIALRKKQYVKISATHTGKILPYEGPGWHGFRTVANQLKSRRLSMANLESENIDLPSSVVFAYPPLEVPCPLGSS